MQYDSTNLIRSASDAESSLPNPGRHAGRNNVSYADGHARSVPIGMEHLNTISP
jgi:prepilin-type processing-associated H-X9-DG protein